MNSNIKEFEIFLQKKFSRKAVPQGLVVRAVDRQSKDLGTNPSAAESVFFAQKDFKFVKY